MERLTELQRKYFAYCAVIAPLAPFLYLQATYTRRKVGRLPDAGGPSNGVSGTGEAGLKLLVVGESTVAGVGAENHEEALTGRFAHHLSRKLGRPVDWYAVGESGITVGRFLKNRLSDVPSKDFDVIVIALGGNDVFGVKSPRHWRRGISELIAKLKDANPRAEVFLANVPMVRDFISMPDPLRYLLSRLAKIQHFNTMDLVAGMNGVYYFSEVDRVEDDFFSDGIHPSASGYDEWASSMVDSYLAKTSRYREHQP